MWNGEKEESTDMRENSCSELTFITNPFSKFTVMIIT
jgi:hypothetical protein